jgi:YggT family protein
MPIIEAIKFLFDNVIHLIIFIVIANAIASWLIAFDVINTRNPMIYRIVRTLDSLTDPLLRPIRNFMPNFGGIDISPIILWLLLGALQILVDGLLNQLLMRAAVSLN